KNSCSSCALGIAIFPALYRQIMELEGSSVAAGVPPASEGGILPPGSAPEIQSTVPKLQPAPPGGTPNSSAGETPAAALCARRRLIVNADDFGRSASANEAIIHAHREGILTSASLMVNEPGFEQAVQLARQNPHLGVGLHLTLICGHSTLLPENIPGLVNGDKQFTNCPAKAGFRYFFQRNLREQLRAEIQAQFHKFR